MVRCYKGLVSLRMGAYTVHIDFGSMETVVEVFGTDKPTVEQVKLYILNGND